MTNTINSTTLRIIYDNLCPTARAAILHVLNTELAAVINNEEVFERWLMCGVPDGCDSVRLVEETMNTEEMEYDEFEELILLAASCFEMDNEELE